MGFRLYLPKLVEFQKVGKKWVFTHFDPLLGPKPTFFQRKLTIFCESGEGVRLPREMGWPPGKFRNFRGGLGDFQGSLGNFRGTSGLPLNSTVRELPGKSPKNFRGSSGTSGEVRGLSRSSGEPDSLPATRQTCPRFLPTFVRGPNWGLFCTSVSPINGH